MITASVKSAFEQTYVRLMMDIIGRSLVMASQVDKEIRHEISSFPVGFTLSMKVFPDGASFIARVTDQHQLELVQPAAGKPDLSIMFKHVHHAFMVFSFQEGTARAYANDRMIADGDVSHAIRLVRCLNKLEALILPRPIARFAVKAYPQQLNLKEKLSGAASIYVKVAQSYLKGSV
ncbi:hypothetical protein [Acinetobacter sp. WZC-1]|uniref:hypothetical protein n=1 Tax=Acinetobacter sp. WZC-1 TaxID=3459034 RepID=UPI00403E0EF5